MSNFAEKETGGGRLAVEGLQEGVRVEALGCYSRGPPQEGSERAGPPAFSLGLESCCTVLHTSARFGSQLP